MTDLECRQLVRAGLATQLSTQDLVRYATQVKEPIYPSSCVEWAEREALPLLREMSIRLGGTPISQFIQALQNMGLREGSGDHDYRIVREEEEQNGRFVAVGPAVFRFRKDGSFREVRD